MERASKTYVRLISMVFLYDDCLVLLRLGKVEEVEDFLGGFLWVDVHMVCGFWCGGVKSTGKSFRLLWLLR